MNVIAHIKIQLFQKNRVELYFDGLNYDFIKLRETMEEHGMKEQIIITVNNPYRLKIRPEKQIAIVLGLSRNQVKGLLKNGEIELQVELPQCIFISVDSTKLNFIHPDLYVR